MLTDVVIHIANEQPVLADLLAAPTPSDLCLICTNLRTMNGQTPVYVERRDSTFVFPMTHIRFIEIRPDSSVEDGDGGRREAESHRSGSAPAKGARQLGSGEAGTSAPDDPAAPGGKAAGEQDADDLIRRIRDI
jgi:hypothetical protein